MNTITLPTQPNTLPKSGPGSWSREPLPVGTVRIVRKRIGSAYLVRKIKVRLGGPKSGRWIHYARWWWEQHRGRVPAGMRVAHLDGDTLNDDPSGTNYVLATPGDVVAIAHFADPEMSERNYRAAAKATAEFNRIRGRLHRLTHWLSSQWYAVDFRGRRIYNRPYRERWQVYQAHGAAGWPQVSSRLAAAVLAVLTPDTLAGKHKLRLRLDGLYELHAWPAIQGDGAIHSAMVPLRAAGYLQSFRSGNLGRLYQILPQALAARRDPSPVVAVRGDRLTNPAFDSFTKIDEAQCPVGHNTQEAA